MKKILKNQIYHLAAYIILGSILWICADNYKANSAKVYGLTAVNWLILSWIAAGIFQAWIMLFWRLELYQGKISQCFGTSGFWIFRVGFITFGSIRMLPVIPISFLTRNSIDIYPPLKLGLIIFSTPLIIWALYSVFFYFGLNRTFGADHFFPEYRTKTLEERGTFKYIPNSMYSVVLLLLYHPGLFFESSLGLITALIHHLFVWTHYFCTEKPDLKEIYSMEL